MYVVEFEMKMNLSEFRICPVGGIYYFLSAISDSTVAFLERLHNRTTKGIEEEIGKRVTFSKNIICQLIQFVDKRITRGKDIGKMLAELSKVGAKKERSEKIEKVTKEEGKSIEVKEEKTEDEKKEEADNLKKEEDEGVYFLNCYITIVLVAVVTFVAVFILIVLVLSSSLPLVIGIPDVRTQSRPHMCLWLYSGIHEAVRQLD